MAETCVNQGTWWVATPVAGHANTFCVQNVANQNYLTSSAGSMSGSCSGSNQWWIMTGTTGTCMQNYANGQYMTNSASSLSDTCNSLNQYWNFTDADYNDIASN
jgi:hypothetical protein